MKPTLGLLFLTTLAASALAQEYRGFDPKRDSAADLKKAVAQAKRSNKRILLDVGGNWCIWCRRLDEFFAKDAEAKKLLTDRYVVVKVNYSPENTNEKFLAAYPKVAGYPHLFVLDKEGKLLHSQDTGELETGDHHDHAKVTTFLKRWAG